jgi:C1A family cysteine protease
MNFKNIIVITTAILLAFSTYKSVNNATQVESLASPTIVEIF